MSSFLNLFRNYLKVFWKRMFIFCVWTYALTGVFYTGFAVSDVYYICDSTEEQSKELLI